MIRIPIPRPKKLKSPTEYPEILDEWKYLYRKYTEIEKMGKWKAMERIAREYGGKSASNVRYWIELGVRERERKSKRGKKRDHKKETYKNYLKEQASRMYLCNHIETYLERVFSNCLPPLDLDTITLKLKDYLAEDGKKPVTIHNLTLLNLIKKLEEPKKSNILEKIIK